MKRIGGERFAEVCSHDLAFGAFLVVVVVSVVVLYLITEGA